MEKLKFYLSPLHSVNCRLLHAMKVKGLILLLFIVSANFHSFGQTVYELNSKLSEMLGSGDTTIINEAAHIRSLITDLQPTVYVDDVVKANNESIPVRADVQAGAVDKLKIHNPLFEQVELITIRINSPADLATVLDLSLIQGFTNLKYVRVLCSFECAAEQISPIVTGNTLGIKVFFSISIPS